MKLYLNNQTLRADLLGYGSSADIAYAIREEIAANNEGKGRILAQLNGLANATPRNNPDEVYHDWGEYCMNRLVNMLEYYEELTLNNATLERMLDDLGNIEVE